MARAEFLVIDRLNGSVVETGSNDLAEKINGLPCDTLALCYDIHAGFDIPSNKEFRWLLEKVNKKIKIELIVIDDRKQSNDKLFSPASVCVVKNNKKLRKTIYSQRSTFVSEIPLDKHKIIHTYQQLLGAAYEEFAKIIETANGKNLGDFLTQIIRLALEERMAGLDHVELTELRFDEFNNCKEHTHPPSRHKNHDVLYIAKHAAAWSEDSREYLVERFKNAEEKPYLIIVPKNPAPYFATPK